MDYKRIIKSREMRLAILRCLSFVPDKAMLKLQYRIKTGRNLNLKNPQRYTEKLQWYKLFYRDPEMVRCVDKYDVRSYIEELGFSHILNECYGVYDTVEEIDFEKLPNQFVLKDTLGSGGNSVIIVDDKSKEDLDKLKKRLEKWVKEPHHTKTGGREWPYYSGKKHRIIVEKLLISSQSGDLPDYKFICFNGNVYCSYLKLNNLPNRELTKFGFFDRDFTLLGVHRTNYIPIEIQVEKPKTYDKMILIAEKLSEKYPHVRVDLYNVNGNVIFGELTYFWGSGYLAFEPDSFDFDLGEKFDLSDIIM